MYHVMTTQSIMRLVQSILASKIEFFRPRIRLYWKNNIKSFENKKIYSSRNA